jgi:hypothetical protein
MSTPSFVCHIFHLLSSSDCILNLKKSWQKHFTFHISYKKGKMFKLSLCLTKYHAMKTIGGVEVQLHAFLTSALDGGEWSASHPGCFTPGERAPGTHCIGGGVGSRAILDMVVKKKIPSPHQKLNPRTPIVQPIAQCYTNRAISHFI